MLTDLVVDGVGVIDHAELILGPGCIALTGETGAGKTLVVASLSLLVGGRADRSIVRSGADEARVEGRFVVSGDHPAVGRLIAHGFLDEGARLGQEVEIILTRSVASDGRAGRARINGRLAAVGTLTEIGAALVEVAGQHEHVRLASPARRREILDAYAGPQALALAADVREAVADATAAERRFEELRATEQERVRELDVLDFETAEIESAGLSPGEADAAAAQAARLESAEGLALGLSAAIERIRGEGGADELVADARRGIDALSRADPDLATLGARLEAVSLELSDIAEELAGQMLEPDPAALETLRERLALIRRLERKYGSGEREILHYLERAATKRAELQRASADIERSERGRDDSRRRARELAGRLSEIRHDAARRLAEAMHARLEDLALGGAGFEVALEPAALYEGGLERVELLVSPGAGDVLRPAAKIASGGELSRIALALYLLTAQGAAPTMIFDEVDAGVGGRAAQSVGRALSGLARDRDAQVIVVTHLPQVAAYADTHLRVTKVSEKGRAEAGVRRVDGPERVAELSRMLAGLPESDRARDHARELLELAASS
jgi:DNA repair protein RecN (Recombination protein N)